MDSFRLLNVVNGANTVLPLRQLTNPRGSYAELDFSQVTEPGTYRIQCGMSASEDFPIRETSWDLLIDATLNTFHGFRCGCAVPRAHDACHLDTFVEYNGERRSMAGGWHDAANNTQKADSTSMSVYTLLQLYESLKDDRAQSARAGQVLEEAKWGLEWQLKMRFAPGIRMIEQSHVAYWTDTKVGTDDDVVQTNAGHDLRENIFALVSLAAAARSLTQADATLAARSLKAAEEDYADIRTELHGPITPKSYADAGRGTWRDLVGYLTVATVDLYLATGRPGYHADAMRYGRWLLDLQEQSFVGGSTVTGYFYADAARTEIQRELYGSCDDCGPLALKALCNAFPGDAEWIDWYAGILIYSEYYCVQGSKASAPFHVIPSAVWRRAELETDLRPDIFGERMVEHSIPMYPTPPSRELTRRQMLQMYEAGTPLAEGMRLRIQPIWYNHIQHGSTTAHLCRTAGLGCAAQVRGSSSLADLAARQIEWVVGANPFSRSLMFGVGYDYWQNFTVDNINFVGGMGLGLNSYEADAPAWPNNAVFPYKEQWSYTTSRMALNLALSAAPARIKGRAAADVEMKDLATGNTLRLRAGSFRRTLQPGRYTASSRNFEWSLELVSGREYTFAFDSAKAVELTLQQQREGRSVKISARLRGHGKHEVRLAVSNLSDPGAARPMSLEPADTKTIYWNLNLLDTSRPWIAVAVPDNQMDLRQEVFGRFGTFTELS